MANLLDIRRRIKSVKNTQQITKAMKMVSAAKLKRAQNRVVNARPFANKMSDVLGELSGQTSEDFHHPLLDERGDQRYLIVLITADKGLCGAFNTNLLKAAQNFVKEHPDKSIDLLAIGRKGRDFFRRRRAQIVGEYVGLTGKGRVEFSEALDVAHDVIKRFTEDEELDKVFLIFNEFKSALTQRVLIEQLLPISGRTENLFDEFIRALAEVSGLNNQQLEANKVAFISDFMLRPEFVREYGSLNNQQYVDKFLQTAGVTLSSRQSMIDGLNNASLTRAQVLRQIAESVEVHQKYDSPELREYIYEQPPAEIFSRLLPRLVETQIFRALLESIASEQGARMTAMDAASKNAGELISSLTLNMNRVRQAAITREIIEIVSGAAAL